MHCDEFVSQKEFKQIFERAAKVFCPFPIKGRLVLKKVVFSVWVSMLNMGLINKG